jgi:hypothetical protein
MYHLIYTEQLYILPIYVLCVSHDSHHKQY